MPGTQGPAGVKVAVTGASEAVVAKGTDLRDSCPGPAVRWCVEK